MLRAPGGEHEVVLANRYRLLPKASTAQRCIYTVMQRNTFCVAFRGVASAGARAATARQPGQVSAEWIRTGAQPPLCAARHSTFIDG